MKMIVKIFVQVLCMHLVVVGLNLQGSQDKQKTQRTTPTTVLNDELMTDITTTQRAMPTTVLNDELMTDITTTQRTTPTTVLNDELMTYITTTQRALPTTLLQTVSMAKRTTTKRAKPTTLLQTVLMTGRTTTRRTLRRSTPIILDNKFRNGLPNSTSHDSTPGKKFADLSSETSKSAGTHVAESSTITTPSWQEDAMRLFIWNLTAKATGHDWTDHNDTYYEDYLHILYEHCAREYGWNYCLENLEGDVLPLCNDIRANKTYYGSIQIHPYIFEYFDYYNLDILTLSCQQYDDSYQINDGFLLAYYIVMKVLESLGLLGNGLSILTIYTADKELTSTSIYLIALAIADSVYLLFAIAILDELEIPCEMSEVVVDAFVCSSAWFLVIITVERFKSIYNPFTVKKHCNPCTATIYIIIIPVICSAVYITMYLSGLYDQFCYSTTDKEGHEASQKLNVTWFVLVFLIPFLLIFTLNIAIVRSLFKAAKQRQDMSTSDLDKERRITRTLAIVTIAYLVLVGPHYTFMFIRDLASQYYDVKILERMQYTLLILYILKMVNYCINFLIYTLCGSKYRDSFITLLTRIRCKHHTHIV